MQMTTYWMPNSGKLYLPPPTPITQILHTDDFVTRTRLFYHANTSRLLTVGHPYFELRDLSQKLLVPKVSCNQYRVFRVTLPDPNKFALSEPTIYDSEKERLVWRVVGTEILRGQPLGIGSSGHPLFDKFLDTENPSAHVDTTEDDRQNTSFDPKQIQMFVIGCTPCEGEYWEKAKPCVGDEEAPKEGDCPPIELKSSYIQDGDMCDIGLGAMNFKTLQETKSGATLDIVTEICKYPDFLKMTDDSYGNSCFFYGKREQLYSRHYFVRGGKTGDDVPQDHFISGTNKMGPVAYFPTPSGSLVTSESQIMNRPYWLQRAQGTNNGICWNNQIFVTVVDNTRGTNFTISVKTEEAQEEGTFNAEHYKHYLRHVEEYQLNFIFELCKVPLTPEVLAHLHAMDPSILDDWNLGFIAPPVTTEDTYRFIHSLATRCPTENPPKEKEDPYKNYSFWNVDLTERFSNDLAQHSLGRKFLFQTNLRNTNKRPAAKRVAFSDSNTNSRKRRKTSKST